MGDAFTHNRPQMQSLLNWILIRNILRISSPVFKLEELTRRKDIWLQRWIHGLLRISTNCIIWKGSKSSRNVAVTCMDFKGVNVEKYNICLSKNLCFMQKLTDLFNHPRIFFSSVFYIPKSFIWSCSFSKVYSLRGHP